MTTEATRSALAGPLDDGQPYDDRPRRPDDETYTLILLEAPERRTGLPGAHAIILDEAGLEVGRLYIESAESSKHRRGWTDDQGAWHATDWYCRCPDADLLGWPDGFTPTYGYYNDVDDEVGCPDYAGAVAALLLEQADRLDTNWYRHVEGED